MLPLFLLWLWLFFGALVFVSLERRVRHRRRYGAGFRVLGEKSPSRLRAVLHYVFGGAFMTGFAYVSALLIIELRSQVPAHDGPIYDLRNEQPWGEE